MSINTTKLSVSEIRAILVTKYGWDEEDAINLKGKTKLVAALQKCLIHDSTEPTPTDIETVLDAAEFVETETPLDDVSSQDLIEIPGYTHPDWPSFVLSQFAAHELDKGHPNIQGLRRVAENLLGPIVDSGPIETQTNLDPTHVGRACVTFQVVFQPWMNSMGNDPYNAPIQRVFRGVAGACPANVDGDQYSKFPEAMAEVRAEARALKRALKINVAASEELSNQDSSEYLEATRPQEWNCDDSISDAQVSFINIKCQQLGIDVTKFINCGEKQYGNIKEISRGTAAKMLERLNEYQNALDNITIPDDIKIKKE